jgi:hypothetical protein
MNGEEKDSDTVKEFIAEFTVNDYKKTQQVWPVLDSNRLRHEYVYISDSYSCIESSA